MTWCLAGGGSPRKRLEPVLTFLTFFLKVVHEPICISVRSQLFQESFLGKPVLWETAPRETFGNLYQLSSSSYITYMCLNANPCF